MNTHRTGGRKALFMGQSVPFNPCGVSLAVEMERWGDVRGSLTRDGERGCSRKEYCGPHSIPGAGGTMPSHQARHNARSCPKDLAVSSPRVGEERVQDPGLYLQGATGPFPTAYSLWMSRKIYTGDCAYS